MNERYILLLATIFIMFDHKLISVAYERKATAT